MDKDVDYYESLPPPRISVKGRKRMNRLFREIFGSSKIPHPEVDNIYERIRSFFARKFKVLIFKLKNHE